MSDLNKDLKGPEDPKDPKDPRKWFMGIAALVVAAFLYSALSPSPENTVLGPSTVVINGDVVNITTYTEALAAVRNDSSVKAVVLGYDTAGNRSVTVERNGVRGLIAGLPPGGEVALKEAARSRNIEVDGTILPPARNPAASPGTAFWYLFLNWGPMIMLVGFFIWTFSQNNPMKQDSAPKHRMIPPGELKERFADMAGNEEAKRDVAFVVDFLQDPEGLLKVGGKVPKGMLLVGPPGNGKTLLARCIAGEAKVPFFTVSGSEFVEMFVGVGAKRVRELFEEAKKHAPCIIFIDEIDAVGRQRGGGYGGGNDEREQTLNAILVAMDGFLQSQGIFVIAATNRADVLDKALLRPGRFDQQVTVGMPDMHAREQILLVHMKGKTLAKGVSVKHIAQSTWGFSGADLAGLLNRALMLAFKRSRKSIKGIIGIVKKVPIEITAADLEQAMMEGSMKSLMAKSVSQRRDPRVKRMLAIHEGGHAIISEVGYQRWVASGKLWAKRWGKAVRRLTIVGAANTGGHMQATPDTDDLVKTFQSLIGDIAVAVAATIAERLFTGTCTTGNSNDLAKAYATAKMMATKNGFTPLGPISVGEEMENPNLGAVMGRSSGAYGMSDYSSAQVDHQILRLLAAGCRISIRGLLEREAFMHALVDELLEVETIARAEFTALWDQYEWQVREVSDLEVEAALSSMWPLMASLTSGHDGDVAILDGEYVTVAA